MNKRRIKMRDVFLFFVVITVVCFFFTPVEFFWFMAGFTGIIGFVYLVTVWDEVVAWWSTR